MLTEHRLYGPDLKKHSKTRCKSIKNWYLHSYFLGGNWSSSSVNSCSDIFRVCHANIWSVNQSGVTPCAKK